jgi:hypothetical protein
MSSDGQSPPAAPGTPYEQMPTQPVAFDQYGQPMPVTGHPGGLHQGETEAPWHTAPPSATQHWAQPPYATAQPLSTQPFPAQPFAQPERQRSHTRLYVGLGVAAAAVAGVVAAVLMLSQSGKGTTPTAQGAGAASGAAGSAGAPSGDSAKSGTSRSEGSAPSRMLAVPLTAGPLRLVTNADTAQRISDLKRNLIGNAGYPDPQVGFYRIGPAGPYSVWLLAQSTVANADFQSSLAGAGAAAVLSQIVAGASMSDVTPQDPGPLGGALDCGQLSVSGTRIRSCVWLDRSAFGWVYFLPSVNQSKILQYTLDLRAAAEH